MPRRIGQNIEINAWNLSNPSEREQYESEVAIIIAADLLNGSQVGRAVVESIQAVRGRNMRIQPWTESSENAEAFPLDWRGATSRGEPLRDVQGRNMNLGFGSGVGTSTVIRFSPSLHKIDLHRTFSCETAVGVQWDRAEVLLHEICHGLRQMLGVQTMRPMTNNLENDEEFFAILVTNIYSSEKNRPLLADHGSRELRHPEMWLNNLTYRTKIQSFKRQMTNFSRRMEALNITFNPFRDIPTN